MPGARYSNSFLTSEATGLTVGRLRKLLLYTPATTLQVVCLNKAYLDSALFDRFWIKDQFNSGNQGRDHDFSVTVTIQEIKPLNYEDQEE